MFDLEEVERRKAAMELKKQQAKQKTQLGNANENAEVISTNQILDRDDSFVYYFRADENMRNAYGVKTVNKKWVVFDVAKFDKVDSVKREKLRPWWNKPL